MSRLLSWTTLAVATLAVTIASAATPGLDKSGKPDLKSVGALAFGPKGVLFVGDPQGAQIVAVGVNTPADTAPIRGDFKLEGADAKIAALIGTKADDITVADLAVEPGTNVAYVSVMNGKGPTAQPAIVRVDGKGNVTALSLDKVDYATVAISSAAPAGASDKKGQSLRNQSITDLGFVDGKVFIAGLSNEEFASKLRSVEFPFKSSDTSTSVEIIHTAHGARVETNAPVRTFVPFNVGGEPQILAAYTCTPLVTFPVKALKPGEKIRGKSRRARQSQSAARHDRLREGRQAIFAAVELGPRCNEN